MPSLLFFIRCEKGGALLKKSYKKILAIILCFSMGLSCFRTLGVYASELKSDETSTENSTTEILTEEFTDTQQPVEQEISEEYAVGQEINSGWEPSKAEIGYLDIGEKVSPYTALNNKLLWSSNIPSSYNANLSALKYISSVKNQNPYNTCWAFALTAAAESNMLRKGYGTYDFSEYQLAYFTYNQAFDALGNTAGDSTRIVNGSNYLDLGGTNLWTMFAVANWIGLASEASAPYGLADPNSSLSDSLAYRDVVHMQQCRMISMVDAQDVKQAIMDYGSVVSAINFNTTAFNSTTNALNYDGLSSNHAITIIGWDDNYSRTNFAEGHQPSTDGAWMIKNSWGNIYPYIWVSYEDSAITNQDAYAYSFEQSDNYDNNYQYDGAHGSYYFMIDNGESLANRFMAKAGATERLQAVSIALYDDNINYSVQIYKNPSAANPKSGQAMLSKPVTGTTTYAGYYTIDLNQDITLKYGDTFSVVFTLKDMDAGDNSVDVFVDRSYSASAGVEFTSYLQKNQSFRIDEDNKIYDFRDYSSYGMTPRIKAFTDTITSMDSVTKAMYRLYNPNNGEHFYTSSVSEKNYLVKVGWNYEGIAWYAPKTGSPVYRLYNPNAGDHHYTTSVSEKNHLVNVGWNDEGVAWYSGGSTPLYRSYNPNAIAGAHHYTTSKGEINHLVSVGWKDEGIGWYGVK